MRNVYPDPVLAFFILVGYWVLGADLSEVLITLGINLYSEKYLSASSRFYFYIIMVWMSSTKKKIVCPKPLLNVSYFLVVFL